MKENKLQLKIHWKCAERYFIQIFLTFSQYLEIPTHFLALSYADLRWKEIPYIINKLNNLGLRDKELENLSY